MLGKINTAMQLGLQIKVIYLQGSPKINKQIKPREQNASECLKLFRESTIIGIKLLEATFKTQHLLLETYF